MSNILYIQYPLINIQYIFRFCPIGNNLWRTFDFGASYFGAKLCFVSLAWIWVGKACSGKYDKKNKKWKTDSQEIPTTVIKKMDTGVYWVFVYLQVLIKLMKFLEHLIRFFFSLQHKFQETFILRIFISNLMNDYFITFTYCLQNI